MYKLMKVDGKFLVIETSTEQIIKSFDTHEDAHSFYRKMKNGAGFQGNTPPFFLVKFPNITMV